MAGCITFRLKTGLQKTYRKPDGEMGARSLGSLQPTGQVRSIIEVKCGCGTGPPREPWAKDIGTFSYPVAGIRKSVMMAGILAINKPLKSVDLLVILVRADTASLSRPRLGPNFGGHLQYVVPGDKRFFLSTG